MSTGAAALLQKGAKLKKLSLFANQLGDEGASDIAEALSAGSFLHLQELDVSANNIGCLGVQRLFDVLESQAAPALEVTDSCLPKTSAVCIPCNGMAASWEQQSFWVKQLNPV